jgi:hypothetical protein
MADKTRTLYVTSTNGDWNGPLSVQEAKDDVAARVAAADTDIEVFEKYDVWTTVLVEFIGKGKK